MLSIFDALGVDCLAAIADAMMESPYNYRSGWPDLTMTRNREMLWV